MTSPRSNALVDTDWLASRLKSPDVRPVDASYSLDPSRNPRTEYESRHIPGAVFFDIDDVADKASPYKHTLPSPDVFADKVRHLGLGDGAHIVVYDSNANAQAACRVWWMFRLFGCHTVSVLDGGLHKWLQEGRPLEEGVAAHRDLPFTARLDSALVRSAEEIMEILPKGSEQIVDARSPGRFRGEDGEPRPTGRTGHIPGAINVPFQSLIDPQSKTFRDTAFLKATFDAAGVDLNRPIVVSCGSGVTACVIALGAYLLGKSDVSIYDGSWTEWERRTDLPVEKG